jgi:hypothetical protein
MTGVRLGVAAAIVTSVLLASLRARAESGATLVAIVTAEPNSSLTRRVRIELESLGVDVIVLKPPDEGSTARAPLEHAARSVGAIAAVRLVASSVGKVEVWVADRVTGKALVRELDAPEGGASDAAVAVGSVELLRASLMELHSGEPPHGDAPPTEKVQSLALEAPSTPKPPLWALGAAACLEVEAKGLGASPCAEVGIWIHLVSRLGVRFVAHTSLSPAHAVTPSGSVDVRSDLLGATASYALLDLSGRWVPSVSAGIAAARVSASGTAIPPYASTSNSVWSAGLMGGAGLAWSFARGLHLRADGTAAWAVPSVRVSTPTTEVGSWGAPVVTLSLGLEAVSL